jgi:hypothetical protein
MIFKKFFNANMNHLTQISLINTTLKWHYINTFEKIDSFLVCLTMIQATNVIDIPSMEN